MSTEKAKNKLQSFIRKTEKRLMEGYCVVKDIGIRPTNEFQSYMRMTKTQNRCEFSKL